MAKPKPGRREALHEGLRQAARGIKPYLSQIKANWAERNGDDGETYPDIEQLKTPLPVRSLNIRMLPPPPPSLSANYAAPPAGWEFPNGSTRGEVDHALQLSAAPSRNVDDRRPGGRRASTFRLPHNAQPPHPLAASVRNFALRERAARGVSADAIRGELAERLGEDPYWAGEAKPDATRAGAFLREGSWRDYRTLPPNWALPPGYDDLVPPAPGRRWATGRP